MADGARQHPQVNHRADGLLDKIHDLADGRSQLRARDHDGASSDGVRLRSFIENVQTNPVSSSAFRSAGMSSVIMRVVLSPVHQRKG